MKVLRYGLPPLALLHLLSAGPAAGQAAEADLCAERVRLVEEIRESLRLPSRSIASFEELRRRREDALELIRDEVRYPHDACHGCEAQPEVDRRVGAVREIWDRPPVREVPLSMAARVDRIREIDRLIGAPATFDEVELDYARALAGEFLDFGTYATGPADRLRVLESLAIAADNESARAEAAAMEWEVVRLVNEYRGLMGLPPVRIEDRLVEAARGQSRFLRTSGTFASEIPGHPDGRTPSERARRAGFEGQVLENICLGPSPARVVSAWRHSALNHRNLLRDDLRSVGVGVDGDRWTLLLGRP